MQRITIAAIAAAVAVGLVALVFMMYIPSTKIVAESNQPQEKNMTQSSPGSIVASDGYKKIEVAVNGLPLVADVADTEDKRSKGLAVKDTLAENESMLFVFPKANDYEFWMKDMKFPIDIIWLDSDRRVVHVEHSLEPCDSDGCPLYTPNEKAQYVLETVAGFAQKYDVTEGTLIEFDPGQLG